MNITEWTLGVGSLFLLLFLFSMSSLSYFVSCPSYCVSLSFLSSHLNHLLAVGD